MKKRNINSSLQIKVLDQMDFMSLKEEESNLKGCHLISSLSSELSNMVKQDYFGGILQLAK